MSIQYELARTEQVEPGTVARLIRDDANGAMLEITSGGIAARVKIQSIVSEINALEGAKAPKETAPSEGVSADEEE